MTQRRVYAHTGRSWRCKGTPLPLRRVKLSGYGAIDVPRHIVRIDSTKHDGSTTRGWQVRFKEMKLFSDNHYAADARKSLHAAKSFLSEIFVPPPTPFPALRTREATGRKLVSLGCPGLGVQWTEKQNRDVRQLYIQISVPVPAVGKKTKHRNVKVYVATETTLSESHLRRALERAVDLRLRVNDLYRVGETAKLRSISVREKPAARSVTFVKNLPLRSILKRIRKLSQ